MRKVLLVLEDYNELLFLETLLKKVGFDVESIRSENSLTEKMMTFAPDLVISTGDGNKINGIRVNKKVKKKGQSTKLLLLFPRQRIQQERSLDAFVADGAVETPLNPRTIITSVCQLTGVALEGVMAKFEKLPIARESVAPSGEGIQIITSQKIPSKAGGGDESGSDGRRRHYAEILKEAPKAPDLVFSKKFVSAVMEENRKAPLPPKWEQIEEERLKFVKSLFKK